MNLIRKSADTAKDFVIRNAYSVAETTKTCCDYLSTTKAAKCAVKTEKAVRNIYGFLSLEKGQVPVFIELLSPASEVIVAVNSAYPALNLISFRALCIIVQLSKKLTPQVKDISLIISSFASFGNVIPKTSNACRVIFQGKDSKYKVNVKTDYLSLSDYRVKFPNAEAYELFPDKRHPRKVGEIHNDPEHKEVAGTESNGKINQVKRNIGRIKAGAEGGYALSGFVSVISDCAVKLADWKLLNLSPKDFSNLHVAGLWAGRVSKTIGVVMSTANLIINIKEGFHLESEYRNLIRDKYKGIEPNDAVFHQDVSDLQARMNAHKIDYTRAGMQFILVAAKVSIAAITIWFPLGAGIQGVVNIALIYVEVYLFRTNNHKISYQDYKIGIEPSNRSEIVSNAAQINDPSAAALPAPVPIIQVS
jgi:hypothetical protein